LKKLWFLELDARIERDLKLRLAPGIDVILIAVKDFYYA
jgi:hypothetical protein